MRDAQRRIEDHLASTGWVFLSIYDGDDGRYVAKYFHPKAKGSFLLVEKFSPHGAENAVEVYSVTHTGSDVDGTLAAIDALIPKG